MIINIQKTLNKENIKQNSIEIGILLCFILPPLGILWLMFIGWNHLNEVINLKVSFSINTTIFFFICLAIATIGATFHQGSGNYLLAFAMILGYLGLYLYIKERMGIELFLRFKQLMIIGGVYLIVIGNIANHIDVSNHFFGLLTGTTFIGPSADSSGRLYGSAYNPNFTSFLLLIALSFILSDLLKLQQEKSKTIAKWCFFLPILFVLGIFQTGSRAGIATMFIIFIIFGLKLAPKIGIVALTIILITKSYIISLIPRSQYISESAIVRKEIWENSFKVWKEYPYFGTTSLGFQEAYTHFGKPVPHAHNIILGFFSEYGTIGGLAFLLLSATIACKFCSLCFLNTKKKVLLDFFLLSLPVIILTGIFDHPLVSPQTTLLITILVACWDRYTESLPFVWKSTLSVKRFQAKGIYLKEKPISQHLTKTEKNKSI
jgi:O-antigen ligase